MVSGYLGGENLGGVCVHGYIPVHFCLYWNGLWKEDLCKVFISALNRYYSAAWNIIQIIAKYISEKKKRKKKNPTAHNV